MRFGLAVPFGLLGDTQTFPDPWNTPGVLLEIERGSTRGHLKWKRQATKGNPVLRAGLRALALAKEGDTPADFLVSAVERGDIDPELILGFDKLEDDAAEAAALLCGWSGVTDENGSEIPFSTEAVDELLHCDSPVPEAARYKGKDGTSRTLVGATLVQYILDRSSDVDAYREKSLAAVEKNSGASSATN